MRSGLERRLVAQADTSEELSSAAPGLMENEAAFTTESIKEGDTVFFKVQRPVKVKRQVVIRQGVIAKGKITSCRAASGWGGAGECTIDIKSVQAVDGSEVTLTGRSSRAGNTDHGTATAVAVGTGLLCLPLALTGAAVKGEEGKFPVGFELIAHTAEDHAIQVTTEEEKRKIAQEQDEAMKASVEKMKKESEAAEKEKAAAEEMRRQNR